MSEIEEKSGLELINEERIRQIEKEGWSDDHDDQYTQNELTDAADAYLRAGTTGDLKRPSFWPWDEEWWKPSKEAKRNFEKAGALYLADLDRLIRSGSKDKSTMEWLELSVKTAAQNIDKLQK